MKVIVYNGNAGNACVLTPVYPAGLPPEREEEFLAERQSRDIPPLSDGSPRPSVIKDVESSEIRDMAHLFSAWRLGPNGSVYFDRAAGEELKRNEFRVLRKPLLEKLDVEFMRSLEKGDTATMQAVTAKKTVLRNITSTDLSPHDTPEKLAAFIPDELKEIP